MKKNIVINYDERLLNIFKDERLIIKTNSLNDIQQLYKNALRVNEVVAIVVDLPYSSISQIEFKDEWEQIPLIIKAYNIGDYNILFARINMLKHLNIRIYLSSKSETVFTDLKILASIGIDCGISLEKDYIIDDEKFLDLASYYYMSPASHATIEPFEFIVRHVTDECNNNFNYIYFSDPIYYKEISILEEVTSELLKHDNNLDVKMEEYYSHFLKLDNCSKCPAFKICNRQMSSHLNNCQQTMNEVFEYAELRNDINNNIKVKTICQL